MNLEDPIDRAARLRPQALLDYEVGSLPILKISAIKIEMGTLRTS